MLAQQGHTFETETFSPHHKLTWRKSKHSHGNSPEVFCSVPRKHRKQKPVNRGFYENSRLCRVHQLDFTDTNIERIPRAGVLFYTFIDGELQMCFGRDHDSHELTDFGGTRRKRENPISCAVREGNEESRKAFSEITPEQVQGFFCLYSSKMLIIFVPVASPNEMDIREITAYNFEQKNLLQPNEREAKCFNEISEIVWLNEGQIDNLFSHRPQHQMFAKVRRFIYSCTEFSHSTLIMKNILREAVKHTFSKTSAHYLSIVNQKRPLVHIRQNTNPVRARPSTYCHYDPIEGFMFDSSAFDTITQNC